MSIFIFINYTGQERKRNLVLMLEEASDKQLISEDNFKFQMWIKLQNSFGKLYIQGKG